MITIFWLTGKSEILEGNSFSEAMNHGGYGMGAIRAVDFYGEGDKRNEWRWNKEEHNWERKMELR